jgi:hypothetical protein
MSTFNISNVVSAEAKREILQRAVEQASAEIFRIAIEMVIDPDTVAADWTASDSGLDETHFLWASAVALEFYVRRFNTAKTQLDSLS